MFCPRLYLFLVQVTGFQSAPILKGLFHSYFSSIFYKKVNQLLEGVHLIKIPENSEATTQNSPDNTCARVSVLIKLQASGTGIFCELCKIFNNTFFTEHLQTTASENYL